MKAAFRAFHPCLWSSDSETWAALQPPGGLVKTRLLGPSPICWSRLKWCLRICMSRKCQVMWILPPQGEHLENSSFPNHSLHASCTLESSGRLFKPIDANYMRGSGSGTQAGMVLKRQLILMCIQDWPPLPWVMKCFPHLSHLIPVSWFFSYLYPLYMCLLFL